MEFNIKLSGGDCDEIEAELLMMNLGSSITSNPTDWIDFVFERGVFQAETYESPSDLYQANTCVGFVIPSLNPPWTDLEEPFQEIFSIDHTTMNVPDWV